MSSSGVGLHHTSALVADETTRMALARCPQADGCIGLGIDLATQAVAEVKDIAAVVLWRRPSGVELKTLNAVGRGPGGRHVLRRFLGRAWLMARPSESPEHLAVAADDGEITKPSRLRSHRTPNRHSSQRHHRTSERSLSAWAASSVNDCRTHDRGRQALERILFQCAYKALT